MSQKINIFNKSVFAMNTGLDIVFWGINTNIGNYAFEKIQSSVAQLENILSCYSSTSELYNLNSKAKGSFAKVSDTLFECIELCKNFNKRTNGYFDISMGKFFKALKDNAQVDTLNISSLMAYIETNEEQHTVIFKHPDLLIDFGAIGKGIALSLIRQILEDMDIENAFVSFGGSSIITCGRHPYGPHWPLQLAKNNGSFETLKLNNSSVSISGSLCNKPSGNKQHVINPVLSQPLKAEKIVVVQNNNPVEAEVLSTTLLIAPEVEHKEILKNFESVNYQIITN